MLKLRFLWAFMTVVVIGLALRTAKPLANATMADGFFWDSDPLRAKMGNSAGEPVESRFPRAWLISRCSGQCCG